VAEAKIISTLKAARAEEEREKRARYNDKAMEWVILRGACTA